MKTGFDWQTEDEETAVSLPKPQRLKLSRRQRAALWGLFFLLLLGGLSGWQLWRRQTARTRQVQADVGAGFQVWYQAVSQNDMELFRYQMSTADRQWLRTQGQLFANDLVLGRTPMGLSLVENNDLQPEIKIAPDYRTAEITFEQSYVPDARLHSGSEIQLQHTAVFQNENGRWVRTMPDNGFWGQTQTQEGARITMRYPHRDAEIGLQLWTDLEAALQTICAETVADGGRECDQTTHLDVELRPDAGLLSAMPDMETPVFDGRTIILPTPTLVGLPIDAGAYAAYLNGYVGRIMATFKTNIETPLSLPQQVIYTLCLAYPSDGFELRRYDPFLNTWTTVDVERPYQFLDAVPDDSRLLLQAKPDSSSPNRLHLSLLTDGDDSLLINDVTRQWQPRPVGWQTSTEPTRLLLQGADLYSATTFYNWLDLDTCDQNGCATVDLPGYVSWSPSGVNSVVVVESELFFGNATGQIVAPIEAGLHPVWLDDATLAYARFVEQDGRISMDVVALQPGSDKANLLFDADDLSAAADISEKGQLFIKYMTNSPADPHLLLVAASGIGDYAGEYFIFSVQLRAHEPDILLRERREGAPQGFPTLLTPTGYPPFSLSPDGRWLVFSDLTGVYKNSWIFYLHNMEKQETKTLRTAFPAYPARYPYYDWSADGRWLAVQDDGFMRLVAPDVDFQRLVPHEFDACYYTAWVNE